MRGSIDDEAHCLEEKARQVLEEVEQLKVGTRRKEDSK